MSDLENMNKKARHVAQVACSEVWGGEHGWEDDGVGEWALARALENYFLKRRKERDRAIGWVQRIACSCAERNVCARCMALANLGAVSQKREPAAIPETHTFAFVERSGEDAKMLGSY